MRPAPVIGAGCVLNGKSARRKVLCGKDIISSYLLKGIEESSMEKERSSQAALVCGEAFQKLAKEIIPKIGAIKEKSSQAMSSELGDLVACATSIGFAIELYLKALLTQLDLSFPQTHDLRALYDLIPQKVREIIESTYNEALPNQVHQLYGHVSVTIAKGPQEEP